MKSFFLFSAIFVSVISMAKVSQACTLATISTVTSTVNPDDQDTVTAQLKTALATLKLCTENQYEAGYVLGDRFNPFFSNATSGMSDLISTSAKSIPSELARGLGDGLIANVNLYFSASQGMIKAIVDLAKAYPNLAKGFVPGLLKKSNVNFPSSNAFLKDAVATLTALSATATPPTPPAQPPQPTRPTQPTQPAPSNPSSQPNFPESSNWSFSSLNQTCKTYSTAWGVYSVCPQYAATVTDESGNRIVLTCSSNNYGIEMQVRLSTNIAMQIDFAQISGLSIGTNTIKQSLGLPYSIPQERVLIAGQTMTPEILKALKTDKGLVVSVRSRGEPYFQLKFPLSGSNAAIQKLMQVCE